MSTLLRWVVALPLAAALAGCGDCSDEVDAANQFLETPANLACQSDDDCAVVMTGCAEPSRALCGQAPLNQSAAASDRWKHIHQALADCDSNCAVCDALLLPKCTDGFCGGKP